MDNSNSTSSIIGYNEKYLDFMISKCFVSKSLFNKLKSGFFTALIVTHIKRQNVSFCQDINRHVSCSHANTAMHNFSTQNMFQFFNIIE